MALAFPASPTLNQTYTSGSTVWTWQGTSWAKSSITGITPGNSLGLGYVDIPQNSQSAAYTLVITDLGKQIYHPSADTVARIWTIPTGVFSIGASIMFVNDTSAGVITIASTDTLILQSTSTAGNKTLAANGIATCIKVGSTRWIISGTNLT